MPQPKKPPVKGTGKLNKKVGPLPLKIWLGIAAIALVLLWLYLRRKGGDTVEGQGSTALLPYQATVTPQQAASAGTPSPNSSVSGQLSPEVLAALGVGAPTDYVTGTDLQSQLDALGSNVASQIASATFNPSPSTTTVNPVATGNPAVTTRATAAPIRKTAPTAKPAAIRYYTYAPGKTPKGMSKANEIVLRAGQSLRFATGKGYYAV